MCNRVRGSKQRAVQPAASLTDEFGECVWNIGLADGALDIFEDPGKYVSKKRRAPEVLQTCQLEFALATNSKQRIRYITVSISK